jgi:hypothetical protein
MLKAEFPKILSAEMRFFDRRWTAGALSKTLILALRSDGTRTTQYDPLAHLGVYVWGGKHWELKGVYNSRREARFVVNRIRKNST